MNRKSLILWSVSLGLAFATTFFGMRVQEQGQIGLYLQMPGILVGLLTGFALDNKIAVVVLTVATNAYVYYCLLRILLWFGGRFSSNRTLMTF